MNHLCLSLVTRKNNCFTNICLVIKCKYVKLQTDVDLVHTADECHTDCVHNYVISANKIFGETKGSGVRAYGQCEWPVVYSLAVEDVLELSGRRAFLSPSLAVRSVPASARNSFI